MEEYPERDRGIAVKAAMDGKARLHPVIGISYQDASENTIGNDGVFTPLEVEMPNTQEGNLVRAMIDQLDPLEMLNPVNSDLGLMARSPQEAITCFGIPLNPRTAYSPAYHKTIDEVLSEPMPDPRTTGSMPMLKERIDILKAHTPESMKISRSDTQDPFNLAHSLVGDEIFTAPYLDADKYHDFMFRFTTFWVDYVHTLMDWIGPERRTCWDTYLRIRKCSCNLISRQMYEEFVLPYDLRIANEFGPLAIHPCSGPHVFHETLELLPNPA